MKKAAPLSADDPKVEGRRSKWFAQIVLQHRIKAAAKIYSTLCCEKHAMKHQPDFRELSCKNCIDGSLLDFDFSMALQPIVNFRTREVFAHEALVRGINGESAATVFKHVNDSNRYRFD